MAQNQVLAVNFHGTELYLVEHDKQDYVPMRPIAEGMGLDWATQYRKLMEKIDGNNFQPLSYDHGANRWHIQMIKTKDIAGLANREHLCIPLRKLPAWLNSINLNKVKKSLRETIMLYQERCDDVLWEYWTTGPVQAQAETTSRGNSPFKTEDQIDALLKHCTQYHVNLAAIMMNGCWRWTIKRRDQILLTIQNPDSEALELITEEIRKTYVEECKAYIVELSRTPGLTEEEISDLVKAWIPKAEKNKLNKPQTHV